MCRETSFQHFFYSLKSQNFPFFFQHQHHGPKLIGEINKKFHYSRINKNIIRLPPSISTIFIIFFLLVKSNTRLFFNNLNQKKIQLKKMWDKSERNYTLNHMPP